jgi:translation elongation factor EF-G
MDATPVLLEPIVSLKVTIPDSYTGDVMGDLNKRRGRVLGMNPIGNGKQVVEAECPMSELFDYCTVLRSMTGGRGDYEYEFAYCSECRRMQWTGWDNHAEARKRVVDFHKDFRFCPGCGARMTGGEYIEGEFPERKAK